MIIKSLKLKDYRNYEILNIEFDHATNIFYGDNAAGPRRISWKGCICREPRSLTGDGRPGIDPIRAG